MNHHSIYQHGFVRLASVSPVITLGDPHANALTIIETIKKFDSEGACVITFPALALTGSSLEDSFHSQALDNACREAIALLLEKTAHTQALCIVGTPLLIQEQCYNCALVFRSGLLMGIVAQTYLSSEQSRYFTQLNSPQKLTLAGQSVLLGQRIFPVEGTSLTLGVQISHDSDATIPVGTFLHIRGANCLATLDAHPALATAQDIRKEEFTSWSRHNDCAFIYANAGRGESTNDHVWDGATYVMETGTVLDSGQHFSTQRAFALADVDMNHLLSAHLAHSHVSHNSHATDMCALFAASPLGKSFIDTCGNTCEKADTSSLSSQTTATTPDYAHSPYYERGEKTARLLRPLYRFPYTPHDQDASVVERTYRTLLSMQVEALRERMESIGTSHIVLGVSGGLDSTLCLLACAQTMDKLGKSRDNILAYTMPGFATSTHTKSHATQLCESLHIPCQEIDIRLAARRILADLNHPFAHDKPVYDVTFENVQAGLRADYLFRIANHRHGFVLGTGDLSELALGWCTYGVGDHIAHFGINGGLTKTLIQHVVHWIARKGIYGEEVSQVLFSILDTEISPELIPAGKTGTMQSSEATNGPYELHDFFLYYHLHGYKPSTIAFLAEQAWSDASRGMWPDDIDMDKRHAYDKETINFWLKKFLQRFFSQQFKRTCMPNGPQIVPFGSLSPRGGWNMPSDASSCAWLREFHGDE